MTLLQEASAICGEIAELRHAIHREPEIGHDLPRTRDKVLAALDGLPLEITLGSALTSVTAVLRGGQPGPVVLLRGDMDALPVTEPTGLPLRVARSTARCTPAATTCTPRCWPAPPGCFPPGGPELPGSVIFMFQPGEEGGHGARHDDRGGRARRGWRAAGRPPTAARPVSTSSAAACSPSGRARRSPPRTASTSPCAARGGHASAPHRSADPIPAACEMVTALQTLVTRRFDVFDPVVITVGSFHAGTTDNVIPDEAVFKTTLRSFSTSSRERLRDEAARLVRDIATAHGLTAEAEYIPGYPVTVNDPAEATFARRHGRGLFGAARIVTPAQPLTGAEDFSYVLNEVPGAFVLLGACPPDTDPAAAPSNHSAAARFDDGVLADGAALYAELALRRLGRGRPTRAGPDPDDRSTDSDEEHDAAGSDDQAIRGEDVQRPRG